MREDREQHLLRIERLRQNARIRQNCHVCSARFCSVTSRVTLAKPRRRPDSSVKRSEHHGTPRKARTVFAHAHAVVVLRRPSSIPCRISSRRVRSVIDICGNDREADKRLADDLVGGTAFDALGTFVPRQHEPWRRARTSRSRARR